MRVSDVGRLRVGLRISSRRCGCVLLVVALIVTGSSMQSLSAAPVDRGLAPARAAAARAAAVPPAQAPLDVKTKTKGNYPGPLRSARQVARHAPKLDAALQIPRNLPAERTELRGKRTATSDMHQNVDGSLTGRQYFAPRYFKKAGSWQRIETSLIADTEVSASDTRTWP